MSVERQLFYIYLPKEPRVVDSDVEVVSVQEFMRDENACQMLWDLVSTQFRTRGKFLTVWPSVRHIVLHRDSTGEVDGFLLISAPINWQIDYVVVHPLGRGQGIATKLMNAALHLAYEAQPPYVMLTSKESLRPLYEGCGFQVIKSTPEEHPVPTTMMNRA